MATTAVGASTTGTTTTPASTSTTTATTSAATSASQVAANKANAQKILTSLGAGSGVDVASLAQNLVDAEGTPQKNAINAKISKNQARISGYSAVSYVMSQVNTAFTALKSQSAFNSLTASSTDNSSFTLTSGTNSKSPVTGSHSVTIKQVAKAQQSYSTAFPTTATFNGGNGMAINLTMGGKTRAFQVDPGKDTPQGVVDAINGSNVGITAQLINTGDPTNPMRISLSGPSGNAGSFSMSFHSNGVTNSAKNTLTLSGFEGPNVTLNNGLPMGLSLGVIGSTPLSIAAYTDTPEGVVSAINTDPKAAGYSASYSNGAISITGPSGNTQQIAIQADGTPGFGISSGISIQAPTQSAADAQVTVDGMDYVRSTNTITDIFPGLTLNVLGKSPLLADGTTQSTATVAIGRDTTALTTSINNLVTAYNDAVSMMNVVTDPKSTVDTYGGTLVGDTTVQTIKRQLRSMFSAPSTATGAAGSSISALWQMGFSFDQKGVLSVDSTKLNTALTNNFPDVVRAFTNNSENSLLTANTGNGIAGDAVKKITDMLGNSGVIKQHSDNAASQNTKYQTDLTNLQTRLDSLLVRYQKQFSSMDSIVGKITGQKTSLKSSFDGLMSMYTNKG